MYLSFSNEFIMVAIVISFILIKNLYIYIFKALIFKTKQKTEIIASIIIWLPPWTSFDKEKRDLWQVSDFLWALRFLHQ